MMSKLVIFIITIALYLLLRLVQSPAQSVEVKIYMDSVIFHANNSKIYKDYLQYMLKETLSLPSIDQIDLSFSNSNLTLSGIKEVLPSKLSPHYKRIKLNLQKTSIGNEGIEHIMSIIPPQVQQLELILNRVGKNIKIGSSLANSLNKFKQLHSLAIQLKSNQIHNEEVSKFFVNHKLNSIRSIAIDLGDNDLGSDSVSDFKFYIKQQSIQSLKLNLQNNKIEDKGLQAIIVGLDLHEQTINQVEIKVGGNKPKTYSLVEQIHSIKKILSEEQKQRLMDEMDKQAKMEREKLQKQKEEKQKRQKQAQLQRQKAQEQRQREKEENQRKERERIQRQKQKREKQEKEKRQEKQRKQRQEEAKRQKQQRERTQREKEQREKQERQRKYNRYERQKERGRRRDYVHNPRR